MSYGNRFVTLILQKNVDKNESENSQTSVIFQNGLHHLKEQKIVIQNNPGRCAKARFKIVFWDTF